MCEPLRYYQKSKWMWNNTYQNLHERVKTIIKKNETIMFYNEKEQLYLESHTLGFGLRASLLQVRYCMWLSRNEAPNNVALQPKAFVSYLNSAEMHHSNIKREALGILHGLEKFHHYFLTHKVSVITDHNPPVAIFKKKKNIANLSHRLQRINLCICQYITWLGWWGLA